MSHFKLALPIAASILCKRMRVPILWSRPSANYAATDGSSICLPDLPVIVTPRLYARTMGLLVHETGHILHSDFEVSPDPQKEPLAGLLCNRLEDPRCDTLQAAALPGAAYFLSELERQYVEDGLIDLQPVGESTRLDQLALEYIYFGSRASLPFLNGLYDEVTAKLEQALDRVFGQKFKDLQAEVQGARFLGSTREIVDAVRRIMEMMGWSRQTSSQPSPPPPEQGQGNDDANDSSSPPPPPPPSPSPEGQDPEPHASQGAPQDVGSTPAQPCCQPDLSHMPSAPGDSRKWVFGVLQTQPSYVDPPRLPDAEEADHCEPDSEFCRNARLATTGLTSVFEDTLQALAKRRSVRHHTGYRLDSGFIGTMVNQGRRVYLRTSRGMKLSAEGVILLDISGSMSRDLSQAKLGAAALAFAFQSIEVPVTVAAYSGQFPLLILKRSHETVEHISGRLNSLTAQGGTPTAQALMWAHETLGLVHEDCRRLVLLVSDGEPDGAAAGVQQCKEIVEAASGFIDHLGIHIGGDGSALKGFVPQTVGVQDASALASTGIQTLQSLLETFMVDDAYA